MSAATMPAQTVIEVSVYSVGTLTACAIGFLIAAAANWYLAGRTDP